MAHLMLEQIEDIEYALNKKNFTEISSILDVCRTTIAFEIKNRKIAGSANLYGTNFYKLPI